MKNRFEKGKFYTRKSNGYCFLCVRDGERDVFLIDDVSFTVKTTQEYAELFSESTIEELANAYMDGCYSNVKDLDLI